MCLSWTDNNSQNIIWGCCRFVLELYCGSTPLVASSLKGRTVAIFVYINERHIVVASLFGAASRFHTVIIIWTSTGFNSTNASTCVRCEAARHPGSTSTSIVGIEVEHWIGVGGWWSEMLLVEMVSRAAYRNCVRAGKRKRIMHKHTVYHFGFISRDFHQIYNKNSFPSYQPPGTKNCIILFAIWRSVRWQSDPLTVKDVRLEIKI